MRMLSAKGMYMCNTGSMMMRFVSTGRNKNSIMIRIVLKIPKNLKDMPVSYKGQIQDVLKRA